MKNIKRVWTSLILCICFFLLIIDARTAAAGAADGIKLCLYTVIPSLFPFFVLSALINAKLLGASMRIARPLGKLCGIPKGAESLLILGLVGGYPVGAQCINDAYRTKAISLSCSRRMLGFCNNAGPAFIFGLGCCLFRSPVIPWAVWGIQIFSAISVGVLLPKIGQDSSMLKHTGNITFPQALEKSIRTMATVCGWVVVFRTILCFCTRWFLWLFPQNAQILIVGITELSNGCVGLINVSNEGLRFILFNIMLSFGGICVTMQTLSVAKDIDTGSYFPGKLLQTAITFLLSVLVQPALFPSAIRASIPAALTGTVAVMFLTLLIILYKRKKTVAFAREMLYNT